LSLLSFLFFWFPIASTETIILGGFNLTILSNYQPGSLKGSISLQPFTPSYTEPYFGTSKDYSYSIIKPFIQLNDWEVYPVYVDASSTGGNPIIAQSVSLIKSNATLYQLLSLSPRPCGEALMKFTTAGLFPVSNVINHNFNLDGIPISTFFFPSFPSFSLCMDFVESCYGYIPGLKILLQFPS